jgi:spoIIIJ-associated protein
MAMDSVEAEGNSIDEAIDNALRVLGTTRDRVEVEIVSNSARGLFGLGSRKARIRATVRKPIDTERLSEQPLSGKSVEKQRGQGLPKEPQAVDGHILEEARRALQEIVDRVGVAATAEVREQDRQIVLDLTGDASGVLIGRRGQMLDALEYIVNRIVARDESAPTRIIIDSQGYRERHQRSLEDLARRMGAQAKKKRKPVALNPMSPRDRRIIHLVLQEDPALTTRSSGKGYFRKLVIVPSSGGKPARDGE